ncbi:MAG: DUF4159 domain-containing protein [Candidatus Poribacteria bacterium]|nr:DUF4159 domain-containing protein [Candidatus Poribacteria bacterium]
MPMWSMTKRRKRSSRIAIGVSLGLHLVGALFLALYIASQVLPEALVESSVEMIPIMEQVEKRPTPRKVARETPTPVVRATERNMQTRVASPVMIPEVVRRTTDLVQQTVEIEARRVDTALPQVTTRVDLQSNAPSRVSAPTSTPPASDSGRGIETGRVRAAGATPDRQGIASIDITGTSAPDMSEAKFVDLKSLLPNDQLGAVLVGEGRDVSGHIRLVRIKHNLADWWQDPTAMASLIQWLGENTRLFADMKYEGGSLTLTDDRILDAPMLIMTGHDKDLVLSRNELQRSVDLGVGRFSDAELQMLRRYLIDRKGTLFFDDCGFNGVFAELMKSELKRALPEYDLQDIPHNHELYTIYYELSGPPNGADVFWGSENNPKVSPFKYHKAIMIDGRVAVLFNRKDYMCAMETAEIPSRTMLRLRRSPDVYRFMTNLLVYAMKYGGNTNRVDYAPY